MDSRMEKIYLIRGNYCHDDGWKIKQKALINFEIIGEENLD